MNKSVLDRRNKILAYVEANRHDPLFFYDGGYREDVVKQSDRYVESGKWYKADMSLADVIIEILKLSRVYVSANCENVETGAGRRRSSLDIWRHVIAVRPDVDIFSVMETMYYIMPKVNVNYCYVVKRTVFTYRVYEVRDHSARANGGGTICREYGNIRYSSWCLLR